MKQKLLWICLGVLAYIPFHALISTWAISNFGHETIFKAFKDIVVAIVGIFSLVIIVRSKLKLSPIEKKLLIAIGALVALHIIWLPFSHSISQAMAGLIINLRYLIFFGSLYFLAREIKNDISPIAFNIVFTCAAIVAIFGFLQSTVLDKNFLTHFGYGPTTIQPYQLVDNDLSTVRILSTLRGSNVLGAYMVIAIAAFTYWAFQKRRDLIDIVLGVVAGGLVLYRAYSRAAWVAMIVSVFIFLILHFRSVRMKLLIISSVSAIILFLTILGFRNTTFVQKTVFHIDPNESSQINSDNQRLSSITSAFSAIADKPFGHGVGTSGIASFQSNKPYISENYLLEITYQLGVVGGLLLVTIYYLVIRLLYRNISDPLVLILFCSFIGLTIISMTWPVWSDETVAYTWWGLAGVMLGKLSKKQLRLK